MSHRPEGLLLSADVALACVAACAGTPPGVVAPVEGQTGTVTASAPATPPAPDSPGPSTAAPQSSTPGYSVVLGCLGTCAGTVTKDLVSALQRRGAEARRCYNQALQANGALKGRLAVTVRIGRDGSICSASVERTDMPPEMTACTVNLLQSATYPPPTGGCIDVTVPMAFEPPPPATGDAGP